MASFITLPVLSDLWSMIFTLSQSIRLFSLDTWSVIADLSEMLAALVFFALVVWRMLLLCYILNYFVYFVSNLVKLFTEFRGVLFLSSAFARTLSDRLCSGKTFSTAASTPRSGVGCDAAGFCGDSNLLLAIVADLRGWRKLSSVIMAMSYAEDYFYDWPVPDDKTAYVLHTNNSPGMRGLVIVCPTCSVPGLPSADFWLSVHIPILS